MKYIVAVSGGVDSMVLLDMLVREGGHELIVAHFDHGIRPDSHLDAELVRNIAQRHGLLFETKREELGQQASEALARERRYTFLRKLAQKHGAVIASAHHLDDLVETVAINLHRGTGWRGLAVLDSDIHRPLLDVDKAALIAYAQEHQLDWREDSTNTSPLYLRNQIRRTSHLLPDDLKKELRVLQTRQKALKREIQEEVISLVGSGPFYSRYFFSQLPTAVAQECLREITKGQLTRPQLLRLLHAIKVAKPNTTFKAGADICIHFGTRQFSV